MKGESPRQSSPCAVPPVLWVREAEDALPLGGAALPARMLPPPLPDPVDRREAGEKGGSIQWWFGPLVG